PTASIGPPSRSWPPTPANKRSSKFSGASRKATGSTGNPCITGPTARSACTLFTACWVSPCCTTFAAKPRPSGPRSPSKICRKSWSQSNSSYSCIPPRVRVLIEPPPWSPLRASSKKAWPNPWACNNSVVTHVGNTAVSWQLNAKSTTSLSFWRVRSKLPLGLHRSGPGHVELHEKETDVFYIIDGEATFVTGGKMVGSKVTSPGQRIGTDIEGGEVHHLAKGDVMVIPAGVPHWFKEVPHSVSYFVVKVLKP